MPFESLAYRFTIDLPDLPLRWLPLIHPYDADLPLFPVYYFHTHLEDATGRRPAQVERAFGYIERVNIADDNVLSVTVVTNKDLRGGGAEYRPAVERVVRDRLGLNDPVDKTDVTACFQPPLEFANDVLAELWERVVGGAYGGKLPFGRLWDEVYGLGRWVASFYSEGGRKGELIQTHYFASQFGERIQAAGAFSHVDYFLLPSLKELTDTDNPLGHFPRFARLVELADAIHAAHCETVTIEGVTLSKFRNPYGGTWNTDKYFRMVRALSPALLEAATECFNAFGKGPRRSVLYLLMLSDLRSGRLNPSALTPVQCGALQDGLKGSYQSPKVLQIYAQQCFGNRAAMPIDSWVETFVRWPLKVVPTAGPRPYRSIFAHATNLGKIERLIWVTAQARKVHSSACNDALWCLKKSSKTSARGANPLACTVCLPAIRARCPAHQAIRDAVVCFNRATQAGETFSVHTSAGENATQNQSFVRCEGDSIYEQVVDDYSPQDNPDGFMPFPNHPAGQDTLTVQQFVDRYRR